MAGRAPLLLAAALFLLGAAGILATLPGRDATRAFIPFFHAESHSTPSHETLAQSLPVQGPVDVPTVSATVPALVQVRPATAAPSHQSTAVPPTLAPKPTPTPSPPPLVIAAVASDPEDTPTRGPLRIGMVGSDSDPSATPTPTATAAASSTATTASGESSPTPSASAGD